VILCLAGIWGMIYLISGLEVVNIHKVEIVGNSSMSSGAIDEITKSFLTGQYFFTVPRTNILFYPKFQT